MKFDMPKAVFCGLALIAAAIAIGNGSTPSQAAFGSDMRYLCADLEQCSKVIDTKTSEIRGVTNWKDHQKFIRTEKGNQVYYYQLFKES